LVALRAVGRFQTSVFTPATLLGYERHRERVLATFAPPDWGGLIVRAAWSPVTDDSVELEVQASASSVGVLRGLEVDVSSDWIKLGREPARVTTWTVEPRDSRAATFSYDGREPAGVLRGLTTLPLPEPGENRLRPLVVAAPTADDSGLIYAEMIQRNDVARRIVVEPAGQGATDRATSVRYGLFGHDLEKGVVLRARLRGCWIASTTPENEVWQRLDEFLREPPPLGP
jgi:hypothetical protein